MKRLLSVALVGVLAVSLAAAVAEPTFAANRPGAAKTEASNSDISAPILKPIEAQVALAEKANEAYEKEMAKPAEKRNAATLAALREKTGSFYAAAAMAAKKAQTMVGKDEQKNTLRTEYEEPNRQKAVEIFLSIAQEAEGKNDLRKAIACYKQILTIDPENAQAKEAVTRIVKEASNKAKPKDTGGGGDDEKDKSWKQDHSKTGR